MRTRAPEARESVDAADIEGFDVAVWIDAEGMHASHRAQKQHRETLARVQAETQQGAGLGILAARDVIVELSPADPGSGGFVLGTVLGARLTVRPTGPVEQEEGDER